MTKRMLTIPLAAGLLLATSSAGAYTLNAHKAICVDVLSSLRKDRSAGKPFRPSARNLRLVQKHPGSFLAGCGYPDASPFMGDTDPSHSNGWDPVGQAFVIAKLARTSQEKAFALGYFAHLAMDGAVHAFANTYSGRAVNGPHAPHPLVWNTFQPKNFLAHLVAESYVGKNFVYTRRGEVQPPRAFVKKLFLSEASPIVRHYRKVLASAPAIKQQSGGLAEVGMLATLFQRLLDHLHAMTDFHWKEHFTWAGHQRHYRRRRSLEGRFKAWFAGWLSDWHQRRLAKIEKVKDGWIDTSMQIAKMLFRGAPTARGLRSGFKPFLRAMRAYLKLDLQLIKLPAFVRQAAALAKEAVEAITRPLKTLLKDVLKKAFAKQIRQAKKILSALTERGMRKVFSKASETHAAGHFAKVGLKPAPQGAGVDNPVSRAKLHRYGFYRNAFLGVMAVLETPHNIDGLPSADYTNGFTCTRAFRKHQQAFLVKGDRMYDHRPETCGSPGVTRIDVANARFDEKATDYRSRYGSLINASKGYSFRSMAAQAIKKVAAVVKGKMKWAYRKVRRSVRRALRTVRKKIAVAYKAVMSRVKAGIAKVKTAVKRTWGKVKGAVKRGVSRIKRGAKRIFNRARSAVKRGVSRIKSGAKRIFNRARSAVKRGVSRIKSGARRILNRARSRVKRVGSRIKRGVKRVGSKIKSGVKRVGSKVKKAGARAAGRVRSAARAGLNRARSVFKKLF